MGHDTTTIPPSDPSSPSAPQPAGGMPWDRVAALQMQRTRRLRADPDDRWTRHRRSVRRRRLLGFGLAVLVAVVTLGLTLTGHDPTPVAADPSPVSSLLPAGPPSPQVLAREGSLELFVPIRSDRITAIAYHPVAGSRSYSLNPVGRQANANLLDSLWRHVFGDGGGGVRYYVTDGGTDAVDVGARAGTDVYAPVNGQVVSLSPDVIDGDAVSYGVTVAIQPTGNPAVVVSLAHVMLDEGVDGQPTLQVGAQVEHGRTRIGTVAATSDVLRSDVAQYTSNGGDNVEISVDPAPVQTQ
jgi:hypothetical protein